MSPFEPSSDDLDEARARYERVADGFGRRLASVGPGEWASPSPCDDWTARDVASHVITMQGRMAAMGGGPAFGEVDKEGDLVAQWRAATAAVAELLGDDEATQRVISGMFGDSTWGTMVSRFLCADTLLHTWDLARATGQDDTLDPEAVTVALDSLAPFEEQLRVPNGFGAKVETGHDADKQTRLLAFSGRDPG